MTARTRDHLGDLRWVVEAAPQASAPVRMGSHRSVMSGVGWVTHREGTEHMIETASKTYTPRSGGCPAKSPSRN